MKLPLAILAVILLLACQDRSGNAGGETNDRADTANTSSAEKEANVKYILFFGNSLTAGYGLDEDQSFPARIQAKIDSLGLPYQVINGGLSGETSAGGLNRIDWVLRQKIDVFVLELGPNDALRGLDLSATDENLRGILDKVREKYPDIPLIVAGMEAPPNMGDAYTTEFRTIYRDIARDYNARLIPFLLEGVAGNPDLNLQDRMHPNAQGQRIVAKNVWEVVKEVL